ncbi:DDE superfamily endonuclease [Phytophthora infestans]|uniref:DDE superfamily endonuclease n=1 Tax=Phytophthora infestans TaxID=4787 RepID=A0A8S9UYV0_PHYIN|nr:DDE superfamily endonuclease [Phytophthora infestans]
MRYLGVFSGSNSDQSMWNQSAVLGAYARELCPPGINWLGDAGFKPWPFLMVPFDERGGKRLTAKQRCYNYHLSQTRILVECVFGKLKTRFKTLHGVTDRKKHNPNARNL